MKKIIIFGIFAAISLSLVMVAIFAKPNKNQKINTDYLRVHIRANSNSEEDQSVKYLVKAKVVEYLTPTMASTTSQVDAKSKVKRLLPQIEDVANDVLKENGFSYTAKAAIKVEHFPQRSYGNVTLDEGTYEALILNLGTGEGNNWWCVMFPPLCFVGSENTGSNGVVYKSKLVEIINKFSK